MSTPLKIILGIAGGIFGLLIAALVAAAMLFDPNSFRGKLAQEVNDRFHRELAVGNIKLSVFPWLEVKVSEVKLGNAEGFGKEPFAQVGELAVGVGLLPLVFNHKIEASAITLSGLTLNLQKNAKGESNWADLAQGGEKGKQEKKKDEGGSFALEDVNISGVKISDATLNYSDAQSGKHYSVEHLNLKTGRLKPGKPFDVDLALTLTSKAPEARAELKLGGTVLADAKAKTYTVSGLALNADLSGGAVPGGKQSVKLSGDVSFDQASGAGSFSKGELNAAGLTLTTEIKATGLGGDTPRLLGPIEIKPFSPREVMSKLGIKAPETADKDALKQASVKAQYAGDFNSAALSGLSIKLDQTSIDGSLAVKDFASQAIGFALKADKLDADRYLAPKTAKSGSSAGTGDAAARKAELNAIKLPSDAINALNVDGTLDVGTLKLSGINLSNVRLRLSGAKGSRKQQELSANLYGGQVRATTRVSGKSYALDTQLTSLNAGPFLKDFLGKDSVSGVGNLKLGLSGSGNTVGELRRVLNGDISFNLQNGAVKGFNLGQIIRGAQATFAGQPLSAQDKSAQQTDFATFSAAGKIVNGILKSDQLDAKSPLFRLAGAGEIDLVNETINYTAKPTIVESSQGQGGRELDALRGVTIPIQLSGSLYAPQYKVALDDVLRQQATAQIQKQLGAHQEEIQQKLKEKLGGDLGGALGALFGGKKPQQSEQPPQPPQPQQQPQQKPGT